MDNSEGRYLILQLLLFYSDILHVVSISSFEWLLVCKKKVQCKDPRLHYDYMYAPIIDSVHSMHPLTHAYMHIYSIGRVCRERIEVCGIPFPKDLKIAVPVHYLHRMESIWGDPDVFRPER